MPKSKPREERSEAEGEALSESAKRAMRAMRVVVDEAQSGGSDDLMASRAAEVLGGLADLLKTIGYPHESAAIQKVVRGIQVEFEARYGGLQRNARRAGSGQAGLADDPVLLKALVELAAESNESENWKDAEPNAEVNEIAAEYDAALKKALGELARKLPPENKASADDLWAANAPYLVLMTLRGEGVGIWDGDWSDFYEDTEPAEEFLKDRLRIFADGTGGGKLEEAFMQAAIESCGDGGDGGDEDDDDDDSDDEDDEDEGD